LTRATAPCRNSLLYIAKERFSWRTISSASSKIADTLALIQFP
jgi:hypothetical protein